MGDDQVNHSSVSFVSYIKTSECISRDVDFSTLSSGMVYSDHSLIRSAMSSEIGHTFNEKRKTPSEGDSTTMALFPYKQLKADSPASRNSGTLAQLSSIDSVDLKQLEHSHPSESVESKSSRRVFDLNEDVEGNSAKSHPIPVVAKVGIPMGFPEKPLQFNGKHGWKRSRSTSAFIPTSLENRDIDNTPISRMFDLNIAPTPDPEFPVNVSPKVPKSIQFQATLGIDLNHNPTIEDEPKIICPQTRQLLQNYDTVRSMVSPNISNCSSSPYWVDLRMVQGYGHFQGQMVVPLQLASAPPGFHIGNTNNLNPAFYPPMVLSSLHNQPGAVVFSPYLADNRGFENLHGLRQTILSNDSLPFPSSSMKRREPDAGWGSSQVKGRELALWK